MTYMVNPSVKSLKRGRPQLTFCSFLPRYHKPNVRFVVIKIRFGREKWVQVASFWRAIEVLIGQMSH